MPLGRPETDRRPLVTIVLPAFNEGLILESSLAEIERYLDGMADRYRFEVLVVNDGSVDDTGAIAKRFAAGRSAFRVLDHIVNFGLGQAFKTGFAESNGDYVITLDVDLSYSVEHIGRLLDTITATRAHMVIASPYMRGGSLVNVPWLRRVLSVWANRFLRWVSHVNITTFTCMTRAYDGTFIRALNIRAPDMSVMPEIIYKAMVLRAQIVEIPATLDWTKQRQTGRKSSTRILSHIFGTILSSFVLRPFVYLVFPGLVLAVFSAYVNFWMVVHVVEAMLEAAQSPSGPIPPSVAVAVAYRESPHTFIVGLLSLMLAVQLVGLGALALQSKRYFEELFYFQSSIFRALGKGGE
jgi:glycosyltransferase involved in cell wall biosynthesis